LSGLLVNRGQNLYHYDVKKGPRGRRKFFARPPAPSSAPAPSRPGIILAGAR
jgi:hypothetical protein